MPVASHHKSATVLDWTGTVTVLNSQGSTTTVAATDIVRPVDWNSGHDQYYTLSGNTQSSSTASGSNVIYAASGINTLQGGGSQVLWSGPPPQSYYQNVRDADQLSQMGTAQGNSLVSIQHFAIDYPLVASFMEMFASISVATQTNASSGYVDATVSCVLYTRNGSTLSSSMSWSQSYTQSWSSNSTGSVTGVKRMTMNMSAAQFTLMPGDYFIAIHVSTTNTATGGANTTALANTFSMIAGPPGGSAALSYADFGAGTANSQGIVHGQGILSTGATRATIAFSDYTCTGTRAVLASPYFNMKNATYQ